MVQTTLPKIDLLYDDIRDTLNANGGSVTNDVQTAFTETAKINMWSRMKPVNSKVLFPTSDDWWKGDDGRCGINSNNAFATDWRQVSNLYSLENNGYSYSKINSPYRLSDFRGYYSGDLRPASSFVVSTKKVGNAEGSVLKASCILAQRLPNNTIPGSLSVWDMYIDSSTNLGNGYPGVVVYNGNQAKYVQTSKVLVEAVDIEVPTSGWQAGDYTACPIIATQPVNNGEAIPVGCRFYSLPCILPDTFIVVQGEAYSTYITLMARWTNYSRNEIEYTIYARQDLAETKTYNKNTIQFLHGGFHDSLKPGDYTVDIPQFTLKKSVSGFTTIAQGTLKQPFLTGDYYVKVFLTDSNGKPYSTPERDYNKVQEPR